MLKKYFYVSTKQDKYMREFWPGRVSAIFKKRDILPNELAPGKETVAVRMPKNEFLIKLIKMIDVPLVSTSLNVAGEEHMTNIKLIDKVFKTKPDLVIDIGKELKGKPSKLIDVTDINNIKIIRK